MTKWYNALVTDVRTTSTPVPIRLRLLRPQVESSLTRWLGRTLLALAVETARVRSSEFLLSDLTSTSDFTSASVPSLELMVDLDA